VNRQQFTLEQEVSVRVRPKERGLEGTKISALRADQCEFS